MLFVEVVRPMAAPRDERRPGVPVHTPFLPQYLPAMILVYRRVLYEQWQPREMKEGRVFLRHGRSWRRGGARDRKTQPSVASASSAWARRRQDQSQDQTPSVRLFRDVQIRLERNTLNPAVCVSVSVRG